MPGNGKLLILILLVCFGLPGLAQKSRDQLEKEKAETLKKIRQAETILKETETQRVASIGQLKALNQQIAAHQSLIGSIDEEINLLNSEIRDINGVIDALEDDLEGLKDEYAKMVYIAYKTNAGFNGLTFLFSASTFNQFFMRLKYMEQYAEARKNQVAEINKVKGMLLDQIEAMNEEKIALRAQQEKENNDLLAMKKKQNSLVSQLQKRESEIKKELAQQRKAVAKLDEMISDIVRKEMELARKTAADSRERADMNFATNSFASYKARLDWPVASGFVSSKFGVNPHPVFKGVQEPNDGINIQTNKDEIVACVFDGVVSRVALAPPPFYQVVLIQHGEYYTVYSKLDEVFVKTGQAITKGERIGRVHTDKNGISELHFMVWKNVQKLDPQAWLVKK